MCKLLAVLAPLVVERHALYPPNIFSGASTADEKSTSREEEMRLLLAAALCLFFEVGCAALLTGVTSRTSRRLGHVNNVNMKLADNGILGVGIIGAGRIGIVHLEALSKCENAKAVIISNPTVSKAEAAANKFKLDAFTGDAMEVINHPDVEAGAPPASGRAGPPAERAPDA